MIKHLYSFPDERNPDGADEIPVDKEFGTSEQTSCDLRTQQPSLITSTKFFAKKDFSHLRASLKANLDKEQKFRQLKLEEMGSKVRETINQCIEEQQVPTVTESPRIASKSSLRHLAITPTASISQSELQTIKSRNSLQSLP